MFVLNHYKYKVFQSHTEPPTMEDENRDTELATQLYHEAGMERDAAFKRLCDAVRTGDIEAMRAVYEGKNGFLIGTGASSGYSESVVLTEVLKNSEIPLELLGVFFKELGGRFIVDRTYNVCVFSMLVQIECSAHFAEADEVERWTLRMAEVVRYLVEKIGFPIRMKVLYAMRPLTTSRTLMMLAMESSVWACYTAFGQFMHPLPNSILLECVLGERQASPRSNYWVKRFAAEVKDEKLIWTHSIRADLVPEHIELLKAEGQRFARTRQHMQALLLLQDKDPSNAFARAAMDNFNISWMILTMGFKDALF